MLSRERPNHQNSYPPQTQPSLNVRHLDKGSLPGGWVREEPCVHLLKPC